MGSLGLNVDGDLGLEIGDGPCPTKPIVSGNKILRTSFKKKNLSNYYNAYNKQSFYESFLKTIEFTLQLTKQKKLITWLKRKRDKN